jgi:hypothetical protein
MKTIYHQMSYEDSLKGKLERANSKTLKHTWLSTIMLRSRVRVSKYVATKSTLADISTYDTRKHVISKYKDPLTKGSFKPAAGMFSYPCEAFNYYAEEAMSEGSNYELTKST